MNTGLTYQIVKVEGGTVWHVDGEFSTALCGQSTERIASTQTVTGRDIDRGTGGRYCSKCAQAWKNS